MIHEVGSWQHFVKRQDNLGLPIMEVKQKYLKEMNSNPIDLSNIDQGGGSKRTTPAPVIYVYNFDACCEGGCAATVYSTSPSIIVGTVFYTNPQLTNQWTSPCQDYLLDGCVPYGDFGFGGYNIINGVVILLDRGVNCQ